MLQVNEARVEQIVTTLKHIFADGFQLGDIARLVKVVVESVELFDLPSEEKRALAIALTERVIDETDTPWLPDPLTDPLMKKAVPAVIDLVMSAARGLLGVNGGATSDLALQIRAKLRALPEETTEA